MPVTLHVGNLRVIDITLKMQTNFKYNEQHKFAFFTDTKQWTLSSLRRKKISQCNGTRILPGKSQSTVCGFLTVHNNNNDKLLVYRSIYDFLVLFYLH